MQKKKNTYIDYKTEKGKLSDFILKFEDSSIKQQYLNWGKKKYMIELVKLANRQTQRLDISMQDLHYYFRNEADSKLLQHIQMNTKRYEQIFSQLIFQLLPQRTKKQNADDEIKMKHEIALYEQRHQNYLNSLDKEGKSKFPIKLFLFFNVYIVKGNIQKTKVYSVGNISAQQIGHLITVKAMVVRVSQIRPQIIVATYNCDLCGYQIYQDVDGRPDFLPLTECVSNVCIQRKSHGKIQMNPGTSKMVAYQQIKIQQTSDQLEDGGVPRNFTLVAKRDNTKQCVPGDVIMVEGILLPLQKATRKKTNYNYISYIEVNKIWREKKRYTEMKLLNSLQSQIRSVKMNMPDSQIYKKLAQSLAPQIYGMLDVKKALLLLMIGGPGVQKNDGMKIRGQINIALIGDPGVAKSQLLKKVTFLSPRSVYSTGKGSSGVGLTAAVIRDPITNQLSLEGGALVLADTGVCCIDQFDKMDEDDRTAIHQVMQQQSVSIAKAGIVTSLNARTAILAAANPFFGRYDKRKSIQQNLKLPAALLSRFDLIFLLLDDNKTDDELSKKILNTHTIQKTQKSSFSTQFIRSYISFAKRIDPIVNPQVQKKISEIFVQMRAEGDRTKQSRVTPRSLLAMLRIASAHARLRFSQEVNLDDFHEAKRLMQESKIMVTGEVNVGINADQQRLNKIFKIITQICQRQKNRTVLKQHLKKRIINTYLQQQFEQCLNHFEKMDLISVKGDYVIKN